ncbi:MAG: hypothetical protein COT33_01200 [Candidatus Nealsonbacteria bacterium CG08_land_8_20_14_0_20_38_20]|uniref:peptide chain release factor N(5)-glutamine methyltransferase n=1 Tax=Candidatus Nealsonbacteria bacterium CG08_land_8_20_14_0_20_38_20 TaxID=1974705 RepID=A0A2H0YMT7_9BACT|nr:MAG: hypothetical protein COT33_01200 [Candidatus Nealsonbacteria bacterium CG08_land_8_20_14_0_20_38_20]
MKKLLLATFNPGKIKEYRLLLKGLPFKLVTLKNFGVKEKFEENKKTLEENAREKAKFYSKLTNLPTIADDSGLEIEFLKGEPGVRSRRWLGYEASDKELIAFALKKLKNVPWQKRKAQLRTILALVIPNREIPCGGRTPVFIFEGKIRGIIAREPKGRLLKGYPFRPLFYLPKFKKTFAELGLKKEIQIGHRKKAIKKLIPVLRAKLIRTVKFLNCKIDVSKKVFRPRPETEFWTALAIKEIKKLRGKINPERSRRIEVLDIFSATGCVGVSVLKNVKNSFCDFVDIDENALEEIKINLKINKIEKGRYRIIKSDVFEKINKKYDFILANPPYVALERISEVQPSVLKEEPALALFGGRDGMDYIRRFLREVKNYLTLPAKNLAGGKFYLEFDPRQKNEIEKKEEYRFKFKKDQFKKWRFLVGLK